MAEQLAGFYSGFDTVVEVAKDKFLGVDLSSIKAEDYVDEIGSETCSPSTVEVPAVEFGWVNSEAVAKGEGTSELASTPISTESPSPVPKISLADPLAIAASLASID